MKLDLSATVAWLLLIGIGISVLNAVANNPKLNPRYRFVARRLEGDLYQDLLTGQFVVFA